MSSRKSNDRQATAEATKTLFSLSAPSEARKGAFDALFFNLRLHWQAPFALMVALSAGVATLGLSENSAATVIGAMIIAPLGLSTGVQT